VRAEDAEDARAVLDESATVSAEAILSEHEAITARPLQSAVFGTLFLPLEFYSL
jgi:hypothetical protein